MKKTLLLAVFSSVACICSAYDFSAVSPSGHTLYYNIDGSNVTVTTEIEYELFLEKLYETPPAGDLIIPESVTHEGKTYTVTTIGLSAFENCHELTNVSIPATVTTIEMGALSGCSGIVNLVVPSTVTFIDNNSFSFVRHIEYHGPAKGAPWKALSMNGYIEGDFAYPNEAKDTLNAYLGEDKTIDIPASVKVITRGAFSYRPSLVSVTIPNTVDSVGLELFEGCTGLVSATFPNHITRVGMSTFQECSSLQYFDVPDSAILIGPQAFSKCTSLLMVTIGYSVESIGPYAFNRCSSLKVIESKAPVAPSLLPGAFNNVSEDVIVVVPGGSLDSYKENWSYFSKFMEYWDPQYNVSSYTYEGQTLYYKLKTDYDRGLTYAIVSYPILNVTTVETLWDGYQKPVGDVVIPGTVELNGISYPVLDVGRCSFAYCDGVTSVAIPEGVFKVGNAAFYNCHSLTEVKLPQSVTDIDRYAFSECENIESITLACATPPSAVDNTFSTYDATLYVPDGAAEAYRQHSVWGRFANIVEGDPTGIRGNDSRNIRIYARNGRIVVEGADGENVQVFDMKGQPQPAAQYPLPTGIYMVKVGNRLTKKVVLF